MTTVGRARRVEDAEPGSEASVYDDLRRVRSSGGFCTASADDLRGTRAALCQAGRDDSITSAIELLRLFTNATISKFFAGGAPASRHAMGAKALEVLLLGNAPPDESFLTIRETIGQTVGELVKATGSADAVRRSEDVILRMIARDLKLSLHAPAPIGESGSLDIQAIDVLDQQVSFDDLSRLIEASYTLRYSDFLLFGTSTPRKTEAVYPEYVDGFDVVIMDIARFLREFLLIKSRFMRQGRIPRAEQTGLHAVVVYAKDIEAALENRFGPSILSMLRIAYPDDEPAELNAFLDSLARHPAGPSAVVALRQWHYAYHEGTCKERAFVSRDDNDIEFINMRELCDRHGILRALQDILNVQNAVLNGQGKDWLDRRFHAMNVRDGVVHIYEP